MTTTPETRPVVEIIADTLMALHRREPIEPTTAHRQARRIEKALDAAGKLKSDPMTTTPNPTAEQIVHDAIYGTKLMEPELRTLLANDSWALTRKAVAALRAAGLLGDDPTEEQVERAARVLFEIVRSSGSWGSTGRTTRNTFQGSARRILAAAGVAPQESSPVASTPTVSDDSGHGGDDDRGGREDGPEDEGRSHQATVAGTPQRPCGCAECHRASGHKMDCSHRLAPSPDREKLIAEYVNPRMAGRQNSDGHLMAQAFRAGWDAALAAQPVLDPDGDERVIAWEQIAKHPAFRPCYSEERPLLHSVLDRLTNMLELEQTVRELAPAPDIVLDPEKVAAFGEDWYDRWAGPGEQWTFRDLADALCEAAKRGELSA